MKQDRKTTFTIEEIEKVLKPIVLQNFNYNKRSKKCKSLEVVIDEETIYALSDRYKLFFTKGYKCSCCEIEGSFWGLEKDLGSTRYHLNLYGINKVGKETLITKDHIIPKCAGGLNRIENYQTMCCNCNAKKGGVYEC